MKRLLTVLVAAITATATACSTPSASPSAVSSTGGARAATVFAAASLHDAFPAIDDTPTYSFDGSSGLVDQLAGGAPADVFASADRKNMDKAIKQGIIDGEPQMFATNHLVLITPAGNPAHVTGLDDTLGSAKLIVCAPEVPCGNATARLAEKVGVTLAPKSEEQKVTDVLGKVVAGEADAGLVYSTDAASAGEKAHVIDISEAKDDPNTYWIARVKGGDADAAQKFIDQVMGEGQQVLRGHGFGPPKQ